MCFLSVFEFVFKILRVAVHLIDCGKYRLNMFILGCVLNMVWLGCDMEILIVFFDTPTLVHWLVFFFSYGVFYNRIRTEYIPSRRIKN